MDESTEIGIKPDIDTTSSNPVEITPSVNITETDKINVFMRRFWDSEIYTNAYNNHFANRNVRPDVPLEVRRASFESSDNGIQAIVNFYHERCRYRFNPLAIDNDAVRTAFMQYKDAFTDFQKAASLSDPSYTREDLPEKDANRDLFHGNLAETLLKAGIVTNVAQGRILGHIAMVSLGYEKQVFYDPEARKRRALIGAQNNAFTGRK